MTGEMQGAEPFLSVDEIARDAVPTVSPIWILDRWWWETRRSTDRLPKRGDVDPVVLGAAIIPWIFLASVLREGDELDFQFRLIGTANAQMVGYDATGMLASVLFGSSDRTLIKTSFDETVNRVEPTYWRATIPHKQRFPVPVYRALYPLSDDGELVNFVIGSAIPETVTVST